MFINGIKKVLFKRQEFVEDLTKIFVMIKIIFLKLKNGVLYIKV
jgi:hypothetical protein